MQILRKYRAWLRLATVLALVALVFLFKIDVGETAALLWNANLLDIAASVLLFVPFLAAKAWRWQVILGDLKIHISLPEALRLYALGLGAGMITPGNVGDAVKAAYFRDRGLGAAIVSVVLDRLWDMLILILLTGSGIFLFPQISQEEWLALVLFGLALIALLALTIHPRTQRALFGVLLRLRNNKMAEPNAEPVTFAPRQMLVQFGISLLATLIVYLRLYLLAISIGIFLAPIPFVASMSLASIASLLAIAPFGLGTREAALLLIAPVIGITREQALGISALIFLLSILNGVVGLVVWLVQSGGKKSAVGSRPSAERSSGAVGNQQ